VGELEASVLVVSLPLSGKEEVAETGHREATAVFHYHAHEEGEVTLIDRISLLSVRKVEPHGHRTYAESDHHENLHQLSRALVVLGGVLATNADPATQPAAIGTLGLLLPVGFIFSQVEGLILSPHYLPRLDQLLVLLLSQKYILLLLLLQDMLSVERLDLFLSEGSVALVAPELRSLETPHAQVAPDLHLRTLIKMMLVDREHWR
jgi:hypothetical protein